MADEEKNWFACGVITDIFVPDGLLRGPVEFAGGVRLDALPDWVKSEAALKYEAFNNRRGIENASIAFIADYRTNALGDPDPEWKGKEQRSIQHVYDEKVAMAGLAVWLVTPCGWSVGPMLHFDRKGDPNSVRSTAFLNKIRVHEDEREPPSSDGILLAARLHAHILDMPRQGSVWQAVRSLMRALAEPSFEIRYIMVWVALEALFGPEDGREITFRIAQRIALFLGASATASRAIFERARECYGTRSLAVHGARLAKLTAEKSRAQMLYSEALIRDALKRILLDARHTETFSDKQRENFLDMQVYGGLGWK